jgi:hypothetical protein
VEWLRNSVIPSIVFCCATMWGPMLPSRAMEFTTEVSDALRQSETVLRASGKISEGDLDRLVGQIQSHPPSVRVMLITSPGGNVH